MAISIVHKPFMIYVKCLFSELSPFKQIHLFYKLLISLNHRVFEGFQ